MQAKEDALSEKEVFEQVMIEPMITIVDERVFHTKEFRKNEENPQISRGYSEKVAEKMVNRNSTAYKDKRENKRKQHDEKLAPKIVHKKVKLKPTKNFEESDFITVNPSWCDEPKEERLNKLGKNIIITAIYLL